LWGSWRPRGSVGSHGKKWLRSGGLGGGGEKEEVEEAGEVEDAEAPESPVAGHASGTAEAGVSASSCFGDSCVGGVSLAELSAAAWGGV